MMTSISVTDGPGQRVHSKLARTSTVDIPKITSGAILPSAASFFIRA